MTEGVVNFKAKYWMLIMTKAGNNRECVRKAAVGENDDYVTPDIKQDRFVPV